MRKTRPSRKALMDLSVPLIETNVLSKFGGRAMKRLFTWTFFPLVVFSRARLISGVTSSSSLCNTSTKKHASAATRSAPNTQMSTRRISMMEIQCIYCPGTDQARINKRSGKEDRECETGCQGKITLQKECEQAMSERMQRGGGRGEMRRRATVEISVQRTNSNSMH